MIRAKSEYKKDQGCIACRIEVDGKGDIAREEMCAIVKAFVNSNLQQAKPGHEHAIALVIGGKIVDAITDTAKAYVEMKERSAKDDA